LIAKAPTQEEQMDYVMALRRLKTGWTPELARAENHSRTKDHVRQILFGSVLDDQFVLLELCETVSIAPQLRSVLRRTRLI
jgi:hypothetical protein